VLAADRLSRHLLDLTHADRRRRLALVSDLLADAALLDAAVRGSTSPAETAPGPAPRRAPRPGTASGGRAAPAERRRAAIRVLLTWREVGRDLAVVCRGGAVEVRNLSLLDELRAAAAGIDEAALLDFLERLDGLAAAIEAYANPELALDALVLAWPRAARAA